MLRSICSGPLALLLLSGPAFALEIEAEPPAPTLDGETTLFTAKLTDVLGTGTIRWDFGDGTVTDFEANATSVEHMYEEPGHYAVSAVAQDDGGFGSATFIHTVHNPLMEREARTSSPLIYDSARELIVAVNEDNGTISTVDAETLEKVAEVTVFDHPVALALAPDGLLWVIDKDEYAVAIVDLDEGKVVEFFRLPYASQPVGIVFSEEGDAFITLMALGDVVRVDGSSHEILTQKHIAPFLRGITISGDDNSLWVTRFISHGDHGEVFRLDAETLSVVTQYDLIEDTTTEDGDTKGRGLPNYVFSVTVSPDGLRAWVPSKKDNMSRGLMRDGLAITQDNAVRPLVSMLDLAADEEVVSERIDLDDRNLPRHVTFTPLGDWAFVSVFGSNLVELRDGYTRSFVTALRGENLFGPVASVVGPNNRLFVLAELARHLVVYDIGDLLTGIDQSTKIAADIPLVAREKVSAQLLRGSRVFANAEDKRMASEGYLSCSSCHFEGLEDGLVWDFFDRGEGFRNTTSLLGRRGTGHGRIHWSGNFDEIQDFENPIRAHQGGLGFLSAEEFAQGTVSDPLGDPKAGINEDLDALAAYVASLDRVPRSPFRNADGTMTDDAVAGKVIFLERSCDSCHGGADFTNSAEGILYDVGTMTMLSGSRLGGELNGIDTPTLLGIWETAPYLHDGSAETLRDVLTTKNPEDKHGLTSDLSEQELDQLVAYLQQIDHDLPATTLTLPVNPTLPEGGAGGEAGETTSGSASGGSSGGQGNTDATGGHDQSTGASTSGDPTIPDDIASRQDEAGCGCKVARRDDRRGSIRWWGLLAIALSFRRRRRV